MRADTQSRSAEAAPMVVGQSSRRAASRTTDIAWLSALLALFLTACVGAFYHLQIGAQAYDAHTQRAVVDRVARLGGTYFTTGTDQKGPLWLASYSIIDHLSGPSTFWFVTGVMIMVVALVTSALIGSVIRAFDVGTPIALAVSAATFTYLVLGPEEYSRELYSRNLVTMCFAGAAAMLISAVRRTSERGRLLLAAGAGIAGGVGAQTMPTSSLVIVVLFVYSVVAANDTSILRMPRVSWIFGVAVVASFSSVFVWYAARGAFGDFWQLWYGYNRTYSQATGVGLVDQVQAGWTHYFDYYRDHSVLGAGVVGYVILVWTRWSEADRSRRALLMVPLAWWAAECVSVTAAQRFFDHYFVLTFMPAAVMLGVGIGALLHDIGPPSRFALAVGFVAAVGYSSGWPALNEGIKQAVSLESLGAIDEQQREGLAPERQQVRAIADLLTQPDDFIYVWSMFPWHYTDARRSAASRYIENRWLTGSIYGGSTSDANVLPRAWRNLITDLEQVRPPVIIEALHEPGPIPRDSVLAAWIPSRYDIVFESSQYRVYLEAGRFKREFLSPGVRTVAAPWVMAPRSGWSATDRGLRYTASNTESALDTLEFELGDCFEISFHIAVPNPVDRSLAEFLNSRELPPRGHVGITLAADRVVAGLVKNRTQVGVISEVAIEPPLEGVRVVSRGGAFGAIAGDRFVAIAPRHRGDRWALRPLVSPLELRDIRVDEDGALCASAEVAPRRASP